jgi:uncharacterized protein RhaS with RHS repeats
LTRDGAETLYRRNRVYDPATGRFTQEDPIGLAGGVNEYGFADADPLNFSDPFGLKVCFGAGDRENLIRATSQAIGATISSDDLDSQGCISQALGPSTGKASELLRRFNVLATSLDVYGVSVDFGGSCYGDATQFCQLDKTAYVGTGAGRKFTAESTGCLVKDILGVGPKVTETLPAVIAHELLGHGWQYYLHGDPYDQKAAIQAENIYHREHGESERCESSSGID